MGVQEPVQGPRYGGIERDRVERAQLQGSWPHVPGVIGDGGEMEEGCWACIFLFVRQFFANITCPVWPEVERMYSAMAKCEASLHGKRSLVGNANCRKLPGVNPTNGR